MDVRFLKVAANNVRLVLGAAKIAPNIGDHLRLIGRPPAAERIALDVLVQQLIRIQIRR